MGDLPLQGGLLLAPPDLAGIFSERLLPARAPCSAFQCSTFRCLSERSAQIEASKDAKNNCFNSNAGRLAHHFQDNLILVQGRSHGPPRRGIR